MFFYYVKNEPVEKKMNYKGKKYNKKNTNFTTKSNKLYQIFKSLTQNLLALMLSKRYGFLKNVRKHFDFMYICLRYKVRIP